MSKQKIYSVIRETMEDSALKLKVYPCESMGALRKQMEMLKDEINKKGYFKGFKNNTSEYVIEDFINREHPSFYIESTTDDYYEMLHTQVSELFI